MKTQVFEYRGRQVKIERYEMSSVSTRQDGHGNAKTLLRSGYRYRGFVDGREVCVNQDRAGQAKKHVKEVIDRQEKKSGAQAQEEAPIRSGLKAPRASEEVRGKKKHPAVLLYEELFAQETNPDNMTRPPYFPDPVGRALFEAELKKRQIDFPDRWPAFADWCDQIGVTAAAKRLCRKYNAQNRAL